jgi:hypothetical protein
VSGPLFVAGDTLDALDGFATPLARLPDTLLPKTLEAAVPTRAAFNFRWGWGYSYRTGIRDQRASQMGIRADRERESAFKHESPKIGPR